MIPVGCAGDDEDETFLRFVKLIDSRPTAFQMRELRFLDYQRKWARLVTCLGPRATERHQVESCAATGCVIPLAVIAATVVGVLHTRRPCPLVAGMLTPDVHLLCDIARIIELDPKIARDAFNLRRTEEQLHSGRVACAAAQHRLGPA